MQFRRWNQFVLAFCLAVVLGIPGCQSETERRLGASTRRELELARTATQRWLTPANPSEPSETDAIAAGYLERLRLGMGSPFRLVDLVQSDPRLPDSTRTRLGFALLDRVLAGDAYHIDASVLDRAGTLGVASRAGLGSRHLALIQDVMADADDPEVAEVALRTAYMIAAAEGLVSREAPTLAAAVTALLADRALARRDAAALLSTPGAAETMAELVRHGRAVRRFEVERPRLGALDAQRELASIRRAALIVNELRSLALEQTSRAGEPPSEVIPRAPSLLSVEAASKLELAHVRLAPPPQTPIVIAARQAARETQQVAGLSAAQRAVRADLGRQALHEESYTSALARLSVDAPHDVSLSRAALQGAVALRAYAQETVWFPGMEGPGLRDLQEVYGLAEVTFDRTVPTPWRPYYRRMLAQAMDDLRRVLPALDLRGLRIHFGAVSGPNDVLALHDPSARRLLLPPLTSAGTLAHEIAHDIDWQVALRRYRVRGDYATDRAARDRRDPLAAQVRTLANAAPVRVPNAFLSTHASRPAEIFARGVEWYVAVALAQEGRRNGYLSSVQDELITGYGTVRPPDVSGAAGDALMQILSTLAPVYRHQRSAFRALYGSTRTPRAYDLVRQIVEAPHNIGQTPSFDAELLALQHARDAILATIDGTDCAPVFNASSELQMARRRLVLLASAAAARGSAVRHLQRSPIGVPSLQLIRQLFRGPMPVPEDSASARLVAPIAEAANAFAVDRPPVPMSPFHLPAITSCGALRVGLTD